MGNIGFITIYGDTFEQDRLFDPQSCKLSENLLLPNIMIKEVSEKLGNICHTIDLFSIKEVNTAVFLDISDYSIFAINKPLDFVKYILKRKWKNDYLLQFILHNPKARRILILSEPPVISKVSYQKKIHKHFDCVFTWKDDLICDKNYYKYFIPEVKPENKYSISFEEKKMLTLISSNKESNEKDELYSKRKEAISYFEREKNYFDLYGYGWKIDEHPSYKGTIDKKNEVLSQYRFAICYENQKNITGYITEKIFDCFFSNCVPVYWGANNIKDYIPSNTFIDRTEFEDYSKLANYIENMSEEKYNVYLRNIRSFLEGELYKKTFDVNNYVKTLLKEILKNKEGGESI